MTSQQLLTIRIGQGTLAFSEPDPTNEEQPYRFEPYVVRSGISMAANLREAFRKSSLLAEERQRVRVMIDSPVLVVPVEQFDEAEIGTLYSHAYPSKDTEAVFYNVLPDLNAVAVFSMNKDLRLVIDDHFGDVRLIHAVSPVWRHLHQRSFTGTNVKLYGYFHEQRLELFCFQQNRFKFCNTFEVSRAHDSLYFLLYVAKQLMLRPEYDEIGVVGDIPERQWLLGELKRYVKRAVEISPAADFQNHAVTAIKGMPYDLQTLYVKGR